MKHLIVLFLSLLAVTEVLYPQKTTGLHVQPEIHYFTDGSGKPFFWLGDTQWELFHQLSFADTKMLLQARKEQGFTVVQTMTTGVFPEWAILKKMPRDTTNEAWIDGDPLRINENYFRRMDSIISFAAKINLVLIVGVYHAQDVDHGRITTANARSWARWLANRYKDASNLVWSMYPHADPPSIPIQDEIIKGIYEGDGGHHLVTVHPDPSPKSSSFFYPASWLSFNTLQTWNSGFINYEMVIADYLRKPVVPVVDGEARYEDENGTTSMDTRRAGYFSMLAGGFYSFGHQDNWRSAPTWKSWFDSKGAKQMKILKNIFQKITWWNLVPDTTILENSSKENVAAHSSGNDWLIAYLSKPGKIFITGKWIDLFNHSKAVWVNPENGEELKAEYKINNGRISAEPPARWVDAVLLVKQAKS